MKTIVAIIALMLALCCVVVALADESYTVTAMVMNCTEVEDNLWVVQCITKDINIWEFYADYEPWETGDLVTLTIWYDEVIDVEYIDHLEGFNALLWLP